MAVMAHPDDAEIWCGGTLALHAAQGDAIRACVLSYTADSMRGREARAAAARLGGEATLLGFLDAAIRDCDATVTALRAAMDDFRPDAVITHWFDDVHPDHAAAFQITMRAIVQPVADAMCAFDAFPPFPWIYCCDTYRSMGLRGVLAPNQFVDVTTVWADKIAAIQAHASQPTADYLAMIERQCRVHGETAGVPYAEAFLHIPLFTRTGEAPLLGAAIERTRS